MSPCVGRREFDLVGGTTAKLGDCEAAPGVGLGTSAYHTDRGRPQPYRYAGAYADPTGLYKMGHRYYDPTLGRFTPPTPAARKPTPMPGCAPSSHSRSSSRLRSGGRTGKGKSCCCRTR
ncbi:RHS repeat-associated core domain-containing protein [Streptomyces althioticus]|uniref:RHS repeat-associated core domain-containing protein n=1 Tax=Streptomyces althioticus TaxID=83380 RepID=UPI0033C05483